MKYDKCVRTFTIAELAAMGINGRDHYLDWYPQPVDIETSTDSHGPALLVTFAHEGKFWQIHVGYIHEDWSSNDLADEREHAEVEAIQVEPYSRVHYRPVRS